MAVRIGILTYEERPLLRDLLRLVHWWCYGDRIRISPRERLLRLRPPCFVCIDDLLIEVTRRRCSAGAIVYDCSSDGGSCELRVQPGKIALHVNGQKRALTIHEVAVYPIR